MVDYTWPTKEKATAIGTRVKRLDGPEKSTGLAKYSYDINPKNQLIAKALGCPHAHCKITSIDVAPALKVAGVAHAEPLKQSGAEIEWQGELLAVVAAESPAAAAEGVKAI
jgi:CO/xanthine dehydrogenase Mo-binding subunit